MRSLSASQPRTAVDIVVDAVMGRHPTCPACHLKVKSDAHFDRRLPDTQGVDQHIRARELVTGAASKESLERLARRFS